MDVFVYFYEPLPCALDEIEDALDQALGDDGKVTGCGAGEKGSNIDLFTNDKHLSIPSVVDLIQKVLTPLGLPETSRIVIENEKFPIR
jgi:hypothetical protein